MNKTLPAAVSVDVDTLASIYKGQGCRRPGGYTYAEMRMGLENLSRFLETYGIRATLFMVGNDMQIPRNHDAIRAMNTAGHEIANHTLSHAQGFRLLPSREKEVEIAGMEKICEEVIGSRPVGFRSPGWNIGDDAIAILLRRGYTYDSSINPTIVTPLLKVLHWHAMRSRNRQERTTMGHLHYMCAPARPYRSSADNLGRRGENGIVEIPVTVTPFFRLPFWATFFLAAGEGYFHACFRFLKWNRWPVHLLFHLSDFVDYSHPDLVDQIPDPGEGTYVPQALRLPLSEKLPLFQKVMDTMAEDYSYFTLRAWVNHVA